MNGISPKAYSDAVAKVLSDDSALITVLQALYEAKEGLYLDVTKKAPEGTVSLGEILSSDVPVSREFAQYALDLCAFFYDELEAYREDREAWLEAQAAGVGEGAMQSADALSASLLYLVNDCHKLWDQERGVRDIGKALSREIHLLFAKTPMSDMLQSISSAPTLEQDQIRRIGCLLGMISYITLKTNYLAQEKTVLDISGVPVDMSFDVMIIWACALAQSKCAPRQDEQFLQDVAVIALCMASSYSGAGDWAGQKAALHSLRRLTAADGFMLRVLTDGRIDEREKLLDAYKTNEKLRPLLCELLEATSAMGEMQVSEPAQEITDMLENAWSKQIAQVDLHASRREGEKQKHAQVRDMQARESEREKRERHSRKEQQHEE